MGISICAVERLLLPSAMVKLRKRYVGSSLAFLFGTSTPGVKIQCLAFKWSLAEVVTSAAKYNWHDCFALVYAHSIDPDSPEALKRAGVLQHRPAVLCLEKDVPERTNKYGMAKGVVAIIAAPAVGGPFVLGALVVIVGLQLQMNE